MNNLGLLIPSKGETDLWSWATVTSINPIKVRIDGDSAPLSATPDALYKGATIGHRVWVQLSGRRVIIHGAGSSTGSTTAGIVEWSALATAPDGYLICNAAVYNISDYPILGPKLGNKYGGNGTTTFGVPDLIDRTPVGAGGTYALAAKGGNATESLSVAQMPAHDHFGSTAAQGNGGMGYQSVPTGYYQGGFGAYASASFGDRMMVWTNAYTPTHAHAIPSQGGGAGHNNMQPYQALTPIIRTF